MSDRESEIGVRLRRPVKECLRAEVVSTVYAGNQFALGFAGGLAKKLSQTYLNCIVSFSASPNY